MQVFSLWDAIGTRPTIDRFTDSVIPFEDLWKDAADIQRLRAILAHKAES